MDFTKEGLDIIRTSGFAKSLHEYLSAWRDEKASDTEIANLMTGIIAWAATGHNVTQPPVGRQSYELTAFVLSHLKEVTDLQDIVTNNMLNLQLRR